jgi:hypothetical protein
MPPKKTQNKVKKGVKPAKNQNGKMAEEDGKENIPSNVQANVDEAMNSSGSDTEELQVQSPEVQTQKKQVGKSPLENVEFRSRHSSTEDRVKKPKSMSKKAGLTFPVSRVFKNLKQGKYAKKIQRGNF